MPDTELVQITISRAQLQQLHAAALLGGLAVHMPVAHALMEGGQQVGISQSATAAMVASIVVHARMGPGSTGKAHSSPSHHE